MDHDYALGRGILVVILLLASASPSKRATCMRLSPIPASAPASEALLRLTAFSVVLSSVCALAVQLFSFAVLFNYLVETHVNSLWTIRLAGCHIGRVPVSVEQLPHDAERAGRCGSNLIVMLPRLAVRGFKWHPTTGSVCSRTDVDPRREFLALQSEMRVALSSNSVLPRCDLFR